MTAVSAVVEIIPDEKIVSAFVYASDPLHDLGILFEWMLGDDDVAYFDLGPTLD